MNFPLVIGLVSAVIFLSLDLLAISYIMLLRRYRLSGCCCGNSGDPELGAPDARVAGGPDPEAKVEPGKDAEVRRFGWAELNLGSAAVIGEGGFSTVYLARLPDSSLAALKLHRSSERLLRVFRQELHVLLRLHHPHIVRLLGYCDDREEGVLVFEYVAGGSLHDMLREGGSVLPWSRRMCILLQVATALEYLHEGCDPQVVHGDVKASNVLLDRRLNPKLCDFGSSRMGFSAAVRSGADPMMGSPGYVDPHYLRTGLVSKKSDVYSFGVLALELITGAEAFCSGEERLLTATVGPLLGDSGRVAEMVDPRLGGEYGAEEVAAMAEIAKLCIGEHPSLRPSMAEIVRIMREKVASSLSSVDLHR